MTSKAPIDSRIEPPRGPRCWGVGLARTGTTSLCAALTMLGYNRVLHNPTFEEIEEIDPEGGADNGVLLYYKYLDHIYPGSKFVLTWRELDSWLGSMRYIMANHPGSSRIGAMRRMSIYETVRFDREILIEAYHRNRDDVRRYFRNRPGDLIELNIADGDGWELLCPFLGLTPPETPFPFLNKRA